MKYPLIAALLLGACSTAPLNDPCDPTHPEWKPQRCERDAVARPERPSPEKPTVDKPEPEKPADDEPDSETDPEGYREWKDRQEQDNAE